MTSIQDTLEPLAARLGDARVVAVGESAHHVPQYWALRHRLVRHLVERLGFTVVAIESGFSEGLSVDRWIQGGDGVPAEVARAGMTYRHGRLPEEQRFLAMLRDLAGRDTPVRFVGIDLPGDLASMTPALDSLGRYLTIADPGALDLLDRIRGQAGKYAGPHTVPAFLAYRSMAAADRDELTVLLAELSARFDANRPLHRRSVGPLAVATARHELRLAVLLDQALRAQCAGSLVPNVRDAAMAETTLGLLAGGDHRVVLLAANSHLQRVPLRLGDVEIPVLGSHLADELGDGFRNIAVTAEAGRTPSRRPAPADPAGVEIVEVDLADPVPGSLEALLAGHPGAALADLRPLRAAAEGPQRLRVLDSWTEVPVADAFDLAVSLPWIG